MRRNAARTIVKSSIFANYDPFSPRAKACRSKCPTPYHHRTDYKPPAILSAALRTRLVDGPLGAVGAVTLAQAPFGPKGQPTRLPPGPWAGRAAREDRVTRGWRRVRWANSNSGAIAWGRAESTRLRQVGRLLWSDIRGGTRGISAAPRN